MIQRQGAKKTPREPFISDDQSLDAILDARNIEIDQKSEMAVRQLEVSKKLSLVERRHFFHGLDLDDDQPTNEQIDAVGVIQLQPLINDRDADLFYGGNLSKPQFVQKTRFVDGLQQSWPKGVMDLIGSMDRGAGQQVFFFGRFVHLGALASPWRLGGDISAEFYANLRAGE